MPTTSRRTNKRAITRAASYMIRVNVVTSITPELDKEFAGLCEEQKLTRSALLRKLIMEFVERGGS